MKPSPSSLRPTTLSLDEESRGSSPSLIMRCAHRCRPRSPSLPRQYRFSLPDSLTLLFTLYVACLLMRPASAVLIPFDNCMADTSGSDRPPLQWNPVYVDARFNVTDPNYNLQIIVWGNVSGTYRTTDVLPPASDPAWNDPSKTEGKILQVTQEGNKVTTLSNRINVLTYQPFSNLSNFCQHSLVNGSCPLSPVFNSTPMQAFPSFLDPYGNLPSVNLTADMKSSYAFSSFAATFSILYGDEIGKQISCTSATITPDLGGLAALLRYLPLVVLLFVGFATMFASIFSPWGSTDIFHWTTNYGRDADLLRLVTPGFGDCLQYIQFVALTGGLTLNYPGFYQPVVSQVGWSALMFNESFVSKSPGWQPIQDGIYVANGSYGLHRYAQLVGMPDVEDIWAGTMVWVCVIVAAVFVLIQLGFFFRWVFRFISDTPEEDLRAKNIPFSVGNVVRVVFNYLLLPIVALSTFQLVVAGESREFAVALAVITLIILICFAIWLLYLIFRTRPRAVLFDDLPTVLLYGPLYNTYSDEAAAFALIPVTLTFIRGIAIGAVQPAGIAQIVLLAICEVIHVLTLHAVRPFQSPTSMNAYHTLFSVLRFATVMLMVAFVPQMGVTEGPKGWIGYTILLIHACVLVLGFFLNALQTTVEVTARLLGAGGDDTRGLTRGGLSKIFGMRQLQRRTSRRGNGPSRASQLSTTGMLDADESSKTGYVMRGGRLRSESAGSGFLLRSQQRSSSALDSIDPYTGQVRNFDSGSNFTPTTPGEVSTFSFLPSPAAATRPPAAVTVESADPYYRPPRRRGENLNGSATSLPHRASVADSRRYSQVGTHLDATADLEAQLSRGPTPAPQAINLTPRADYSTREVDFYYGVRGPALNSEGVGRKLRTGPADPTKPIATATGWFRNMFGGKSKEKGKGFEVVRSSRMPPAMRAAADAEYETEPPPEGIPVAMGVLRNGPIESDDDEPKNKTSQNTSGNVENGENTEILLNDDGVSVASSDSEIEAVDISRVSDVPPTLPGIESSGSFTMPTRVVSKASRQTSQKHRRQSTESDIPEIPRKSSKRDSGMARGHSPTPSFNLIPPTSPTGPSESIGALDNLTSSPNPGRLPFERSDSYQKRLSSNGSSLEEFSVRRSPSTERPTSYGVVPHHSISRVDPGSDQQVDLLGTSAELVDERGPLSRSPSTERRSH
ncbi:putative membrane protein C1322.03-like protein 2 [Colletotrichum chlorophyti]|uniref:Putative membrane protein C1322.03-like protein 2 n=1 Tax=Colletotrichum chlorophyti TaxID=708187 RepID=A0A1Q8S3D3_9PEZI|nr:putative membrane protein C1322.03-like protein 2 [Colletotrichum chlorophyti]